MLCFRSGICTFVRYGYYPKDRHRYRRLADKYAFEPYLHHIFPFDIGGVSRARRALAYPFAAGKLSHKIIYAIFLVPSLYSVNIIQRYLLYRSIGIVNTIFPMLLAGIMPIWMIAVYAIISNRPGALPVNGANDYIRAIIPSGFMLAAINFALMWGGFKQPMLYTMDLSKFTAAARNPQYNDGGNQSLTLNLFAFIRYS